VIKHLPMLSGSPYNYAAYEAWCETVRNGHCGEGRVCSISWNDKVSVSLAKDGTLQALIVWKYIEYMATAAICQGWTNPKLRCRGIYSRLYQAVKKEAKKLGSHAIEGYVDPSNVASIASAKRQGRNVTCLTLTERL
jgi:RimJ/RimL family protein N-acetyltransferase